jgi:hypothetical protein
MRWMLPFCLLLAGCNMAAPGVASFRPLDGPSTAGPEKPGFMTMLLGNTPSDDWVNVGKPQIRNSLPEGHMSVDISEREVGKNYLVDENGKRYASAAEKRQAERRAERQAELRKAYGGLNGGLSEKIREEFKENKD